MSAAAGDRDALGSKMIESFSSHLKDEPGAIAAIKVLIELIQSSAGASARRARFARFAVRPPTRVCIARTRAVCSHDHHGAAD
jgi:hypothetical protein